MTAELSNRRRLRRGILMAFTAISVMGAGQAMRSQDTQHGLDVQLVPTIRKMWSCAGDSEVFSHFVELGLRVQNASRKAVVVPVLNDFASRILIAESQDAMRAGRYESDLQPTRISSTGARRVVTRDSFIVVPAGRHHDLPFTLQVVLPVSMGDAKMPGIVGPGDQWLSFDWYAWPLGRMAANRWSDELKKEGELLTAVLRTEPIKTTIPATPKFADCNGSS